ncbi:MAG: glycosyltransferase family 4 protein [candidate division WWE3 bacterium]|nr:glycosyltransferase family 4 protein [candidate division WWE3 bacterium]
MRVLMISSRFYPHQGGVEQVVLNLAKSFQCLGHQVLVVSARAPWSLLPNEDVESVPVKRLFLGLPFRGLRSTLGFVPLFFITLIKFINIIKVIKPDVINLHFVDDAALYAWIISVLTGVKLVVSLHGNDVEKFPIESAWSRFILKLVINRAVKVTVNSNYLLTKVEALVPGVSNKAVVIGNGLNLSEFVNVASYIASDPYILGLGRLVAKKGFDVLLKAWAKLPVDFPYKLIIAGDGEERSNLEKLTNELSLTSKVTFLGAVTHKVALQLFKGAKLYILPSILEPFGIVLLEAMALGCPIIASNTGGVPDLVKNDKTGVLFKTGDVTELSSKLVELIYDELEMNRYIQNGLTFTQDFAWNKVATKYLEIYGK